MPDEFDWGYMYIPETNNVCRFIGENSLPTSYRDQIVDFVVRNTGLKRPVDTSQNPDPFTGGGAYRPGSSAGPSYTSGQPSTSVTGGGVDPFTGTAALPCLGLSFVTNVIIIPLYGQLIEGQC